MSETPRSNTPRPVPNPLQSGATTRKMTPRFQIVVIIWLLAVMVYCIYSSITESGLAAYVMELEMAVFGVAGTRITMLLTMFLLFVPASVAPTIVAKLFPSQVWIDANTITPPNADVPKPGLLERMNQPVQIQHISWKAVLWVTAIPVALAAILYPILNYSDKRDQQEKIYTIDLKAGAPDPPKQAKFVELTGLIARPYVVMFKKTSGGSASYELFAPITGKGWTPADPVRFVVRDEVEASGGEAQWPDAFRQRNIAQFSGKITRSLPAYVERDFRSRGLRFDPAYTVIEWKDLPGNKVPSSEDAGDAAIICLGLGACGFLIMVMLKFLLPIANRRRQKVYSVSSR